MASGSTDSNDSFDSKASGEARVGAMAISILLIDLDCFVDRFVDSRVTSAECLVLLVEWADLFSLVECFVLLVVCLVSLVECSVSRFESL